MNSIYVPFDESWKKVSISLSGGADSALLAYILCTKITTQELHIINHTRCWKQKPWQEHDAERVIDWIKERFPNITIHIHKNFIPPELEWGDKGANIIDEYGQFVSGDILELRAYGEYICTKHNIDAYYNAVTRNPKDVKFFGGMDKRDIDPTEDNQHLLIMEHMGIIAVHPFRFTSKDKIVKEYFNLDIEELFNITRSCEGVFDNLDFRSYNKGQYVPTCGECFWCKEREWAIEKAKQ